MAEQIIDNTGALQQIETFGAGVIALGIIFAIVFFVIKEFIPALKSVGDTLSKAVQALGSAIDVLNKTMSDMQAASTASINSLERQVSKMETKLDYHVANVDRMELQVNSLLANTTEIKERVRNCTNTRETSARTRKGAGQ